MGLLYMLVCSIKGVWEVGPIAILLLLSLVIIIEIRSDSKENRFCQVEEE